MTLKTILKNFLNHVDNLEAQRKFGNDLYEVDFQKLKALTEQLKRDEDYATSEGLKDVNRRKNRYKDILPYDCSRVVLSDYPGVPGSDFINGNYIKGASGSLAYIASQGPLPNTVVDFWRMIWECEVQVIVMACNEQESGKYKCECYWPEDSNEKKQYGNINVELVKWRQVCPDFLVRTLKASWENEERVLCQFHYTTWPDHGVPNSVQPILELVRLIRDCQASEAVPVLIHCSAGCGRTGTICAIDYVWGLMRMGKLTKSFKLFNVISDMRRQRIAMVQTKEQYVLVHKAVSSLFEQQLRVIDSHTYENLDEDGEPLILKELQSEEVLYEDIMEPESFRVADKMVENDGIIYKTLEYQSQHAIEIEPFCTMRNEKSNKSPSCLNQSSSDMISVQRIVDLSMILPHDYQATAIAQEILNDSDHKDDNSSYRNSTILSKLRREESVKRLISGWNKAVQHPFDSSSVESNADTENKSEGEKHKLDADEGQHLKYVSNEVQVSNCSNGTTTDHCLKNNERSAGGLQKLKRMPIDENHHSGKLVGKATVIRRPSIAKLKALFEKSGGPDRHLEEHASRRRRPLFRSHSHYVGHSRAFASNHDASEESVAAEYIDDPMQQSMPNVAVNSNHEESSTDNPQEYELQTSRTMCKTPEKALQNDHYQSLTPSCVTEQNVYMCQNLIIPSESLSKVDIHASREHHECCISSEETSVKQLEYYTSHEQKHHERMEESLRKTSLEAPNPAPIVPVYQRVKEYSSIMNEKPPVLPSKKRSSRESRKPRRKVGEKVFMSTDDSSEVVIENDAYKLVISKNDNYYSPSNSSTNEGNSAQQDETENTKPKTLLYPDSRDSPNAHTALSSKCSEGDNLLELREKNTSLKIHLNDGKKKDGLNIYLTTSKPAEPDSLYGHCNKAIPKRDVNSTSSEELKYVSMSNSVSQGSEEKLKTHSRTAVVESTSRKSYIDESQNMFERPPLFLSTNQVVKLSQPMESYELKAPEKLKEQSSSATNVKSPLHPNAATLLPSSRNSSSASKNNKNSHSESNSKNLLLHSPPPKSKRNHSSKGYHRERSNSVDLLDSVKNIKLPADDKSASNSESKSSESGRTVTKTKSYEPANRSDPRYFPVTRQTPEDAKYALEKHKALAPKKSDPQNYEKHEGFYSTPLTQKDTKSTYQYPPHKKSITEVLEVSAKKPLSKAYVPHGYKQYEPKTIWPTKNSEPIYGMNPAPSERNVLYSKPDMSMSSKELSAKAHVFNPNNNAHLQHSRNASAPASYGVPPRESLYGTTKPNANTVTNCYPVGPPKPPRTFNHKFMENANQEKANHSTAEGGRYIVSVASPKQSSDIPEKANVEYQYYSSVPKRQLPDPIHIPYSMPNEQLLSKSYPFSNHDSAPSAKTSEVNAHSNHHVMPPDDHIYHTIRENPNHSVDHVHGNNGNNNIKIPKKYSNYENIYDAERQYQSAMANSNRNAAAYNYHPNQGIMSPSAIQYSQSDASIYGVLQNQNSVKPSSSTSIGWQQNIFDSGGNKMQQMDVNAVQKRVYFDTLQRRHKQHVSWEQRRSHDDMDIRPAPSARLKEQIHARRSLVELDNLEISVGGDNGFHELNPLTHMLLPRKEFAQENANSSARPPAELSESLISKDVRKSQTHSKEPGGFGGTLYKAFGKLTSFTKFNNKEALNKNIPDDNSPKVIPSPKEEKTESSAIPQWTPRKPKEPSEHSEQWTEV